MPDEGQTVRFSIYASGLRRDGARTDWTGRTSSLPCTTTSTPPGSAGKGTIRARCFSFPQKNRTTIAYLSLPAKQKISTLRTPLFLFLSFPRKNKMCSRQFANFYPYTQLLPLCDACCCAKVLRGCLVFRPSYYHKSLLRTAVRVVGVLVLVFFVLFSFSCLEFTRPFLAPTIFFVFGFGLGSSTSRKPLLLL